MKNRFGAGMELKIYTNDSEEARGYNITASTSVFVNGEWISPDTATSREKMEELLKKLV